MKSFKIALTLILLSFYTVSISQIEIKEEIQIKYDIKKDQMKVISLGEDGLLTLHRTNTKEKGSKKWVISQYDSNLNKIWSSINLIPKRLSVAKEYFDKNDNIYYVLFSQTNYSNGAEVTKGKMLVMTINLTKQKVAVKESSLGGNYVLNDFIVNNKKALIFGDRFPNQGKLVVQMCCAYTCFPLITGTSMVRIKPIIHNLNLKTGENIKQGFDLPKSSSIKNSSLIDNTIYSFVVNMPKRKILVPYIYKFNEKGKEIKKITVKSKSNKVPSNGQVSKINNNEYLMMGSYIRDFKQSLGARFIGIDADIFQIKSSGIYLSKYTNDKQDFINYFKLKEFGINKKETVLGKDMEIGSYLIDVHNIKKIEEEYIMVAEAYYPTFYYVTTTTYNASTGQSTTRTRKVFDGYQYTHALVASLNEDGGMNWSKAFDLSVSKTWILKKHVKVNPSTELDEVNITYPYGNSLMFKAISDGEVLEESKIILNETGDDEGSFYNNVNFWYDDIYISHGTENYKKANGKANKKEGYYSISKLEL